MKIDTQIHKALPIVHVAPTMPPEAMDEPLDNRLEVIVVFTDTPCTLSALKTAAAMARDLNSRIRLIVAQVVPHALPLDEPPIPQEFTQRRIRTLAMGSSIETKVEIYMCRNGATDLLHILKPHSLVVLGAKHSWWPSRTWRLANLLMKAGHQVMVVSPLRAVNAGSGE
jgi:hypothetical protein